MKITKVKLKQIIKEELGSDPEGEAASFARLRKAKSAEKLNTSVEEVEVIADLMANDPEFEMFRSFVDKFKARAEGGTSAANALEAVLPEYMPGQLIASLVAKAQESLTGDEAPMAQPESPAASAADMDNWESDYRNENRLKENKMKITKERLKQIIKEELALSGEDDTVTENRSIDQIVDDMEKSFGDAHKDLQTFVLSLKQSGMDFQNAEAQVKALENVILNLQKSLQAAG